MSLAVVESGPLLSDLAATINREHGLALEAAGQAVMHAINAGEALLAAKEQIERGEWTAWTQHNVELSPTQMRAYMRIARFRDLVIEARAPDVAAATRLLRTEPSTTFVEVPEPILKAVRAREMTIPQAAEEAGVSISVVRNRLDGGRSNRERLARDRLARQHARRQERELQVKKAGGSIAEGYTHIRKALQALEVAEQQAGGEAKQAISRSMHKLYAAEDEIGKAVRVS